MNQNYRKQRRTRRQILATLAIVSTLLPVACCAGPAGLVLAPFCGVGIPLLASLFGDPIVS